MKNESESGPKPTEPNVTQGALDALPQGETQEELWDDVWEWIINGKAGTPDDKLKYVQQRFHLTRK